MAGPSLAPITTALSLPMRYLLPLALLALTPVAAYGQVTAHQWHKAALQPELQAEVNTGERGYAYLALGGLRYGDYNTTVVDRSLGLDTRYLTAGYEQQFRNGWWSWGGTVRVAGAAGIDALVQPGLLLRHQSALGPLTLGQRLAVEYAFSDNFRIDPAYNLPSRYSAVSPTLVRLRLDLYPSDPFQLGNKINLRPRLSFEPALFLRLQREANDPDKRTIDYTGLRADVTAHFSKAWLDVTPWFALQTQYLCTVIQTDANGNPTSNGKLNYGLPTIGLEIRYNLSHVLYVEGRFGGLPTQH